MSMKKKKPEKKDGKGKPNIKPAEPWKGRLIEHDPKTGKPRYRGEEKLNIGFEEVVQRCKERVAKELGKNVEDVTNEDINRVAEQRLKERAAKKLGKNVADVTAEDMRIMAWDWRIDRNPDWRIDQTPIRMPTSLSLEQAELPNGRTIPPEEPAEPKEPEKKKEKTPQERFDDFMREVPKDPKDSS